MNKKFVFAIIFFVVFIVGAILLIPISKGVWADYNNLSDKQKELEEAKRILADTERLKEKQDEFGELTSRIPKEEAQYSLLSEFDRMASSNGVVIESIDHGEMGSDSFSSGSFQTSGFGFNPTNDDSKDMPQLSSFKSMPVKLVVLGSYNEFKSFLEAVEDKLRFNIEQINFSSKSSYGSDLINFNLSLRAYFQ